LKIPFAYLISANKADGGQHPLLRAEAVCSAGKPVLCHELATASASTTLYHIMTQKPDHVFPLVMSV